MHADDRRRVGRNADTYRDNWVESAERHGFLAIAPEYDRAQFPGDWEYNLGRIARKEESGLVFNAEERWTFSIIDRVFAQVRALTGNRRETFSLFGHSAGGQFVHRYMTFSDSGCVDLAIAANAGWYTMVDDKVAMPYGLAETETDAARVRDALGTRLIVLLGEDDNDPNHRFLRRSSEAMAQGAHRFERGQQFFATAQQYAKTAGLPFAWRLETVPGVAHSNRRIAPAAAKLVGKAD